MGVLNSLSLLIYIIVLNACKQPSLHNNNISYNLREPSLSLKIPEELEEISGISYLENNMAVAIQDEHAILYFISLTNGEISDSIVFGEDGDYEGIAVNDESIFVLRSDGYIFSIPKGNNQSIKKYNTLLDNRHDCESLCYNHASKNLLIACKQNPNEEIDPSREIYSFSLENESIDKKPLFSIRLSDIKRYLETCAEDHEILSLKEHFELADDDFFYPSDIAVHPLSGDIYICSAKKISMLMTLSQEGKIKKIQLIPEDILPQTEGISFSPQGELILSTESKSKDERLFIYKNQE